MVDGIGSQISICSTMGAGNPRPSGAAPPAAADARSSLLELAALATRCAEVLAPEIERAGELLADCLVSGKKVLACGNGGSAADAQHFVAELVGRMMVERRALPAISLSSDPSVVTALGNDYGYEQLFARQVDAFGAEGDVLVAISTSGRSPNVLRAVASARNRGMRVIALLGEKGDASLRACEVCLHVPSGLTPRIQEVHMAVLHALCTAVETRVSQAPSSR